MMDIDYVIESILISYDSCGTVSSMGPGNTVSFNCNWMVGKFVTIVVPDRTASLSLCEVQVFGQQSGKWLNDIHTWLGIDYTSMG